MARPLSLAGPYEPSWKPVNSVQHPTELRQNAQQAKYAPGNALFDQKRYISRTRTYSSVPGMAQQHVLRLEQQKDHQGLQLFLYDDPHSEYCAKVKVAMYHKGLTWQTLPVKPCGSLPSPEFLARVPLGKIPALVVAGNCGAREDGNGVPGEFVLYESEVINEWLEEQFPLPAMLPDNPLLRSQARLIARFHDLYLEPALRLLYPHVNPVHRNTAAVAAAAQEFYTKLGHLEAMLPANHNTYSVGQHLSLADCGYPGLWLYAEMIWPVLGLGQLRYAGYPKIAKWRETLWRDESVVRVLEELRPAAQQWVDSKLRHF